MQRNSPDVSQEVVQRNERFSGCCGGPRKATCEAVVVRKGTSSSSEDFVRKRRVEETKGTDVHICECTSSEQSSGSVRNDVKGRNIRRKTQNLSCSSKVEQIATYANTVSSAVSAIHAMDMMIRDRQTPPHRRTILLIQIEKLEAKLMELSHL